MKTTTPTRILAPLARRDLVAIFAYISRGTRSFKSVDGSFDRPETHLDRLTAAARMQ